MLPEIRYPVTYPCANCGESLEALADIWQDWLRCPFCGKAGRPPYHRKPSERVKDDILYIGTFTTNAGSAGNGSTASAWPGSPSVSNRSHDPDSGGSGRRVALGLGFFLSSFLAIVSVVQRNPSQAGVFGVGALVLIVFLVMSTRRG